MKKQPTSSNHAFLWLLLGALIWIGLILCEPWLSEGTPTMKIWGMGITLFFSPTCHQHAGRCYTLASNALPVCARCFGLYAGFLLGTIVSGFMGTRAASPPSRRWLLALALPMIFEFAMEKTGLMDGTRHMRAITGGLAGFIVPFYVLPALNELFKRYKTRR